MCIYRRRKKKMRVSVAWKKAVETFRHGFFARPRPTSSNISPSSFSILFSLGPTSELSKRHVADFVDEIHTV